MSERINYIEGNTDYSTDEPLWKVAVLSVVTLNLYLFYWFYTNLRLIRFLTKQNVSPWLFFLMGVPVINIALPYYLFYNVFKLNSKNYIKNNFMAFFLAIIVLTLYYSVKLDIPYRLIALTTFIPFLYMQKKINTFIKNN